MKPVDDESGMLDRVNDCERARHWLHEACDERRALDAELHVSRCASCQQEAALLQDLEQLLVSEPAVEVPSDLVPGVMALVKADIARARRNARLAYAGAVAAIVALAFGIAFFDLAAGASGLAQDAVGWLQAARAEAPAVPDASSVSVPLPGLGYALAALGTAALIVIAQVRYLATRRATA